mmetsp:Transcript_50139/g.119351  ORF Transcript_50139/g.119351 Transcript_50139/m.119351 type:complete len:706 (+) Transcript_50139:80-2197(+)
MEWSKDELLLRLGDQQQEVEFLRELLREKDSAIDFFKTKVATLRSKSGVQSSMDDETEERLRALVSQGERRAEELQKQLSRTQEDLGQCRKSLQGLQKLQVQLAERDREAESLKASLGQKEQQLQEMRDGELKLRREMQDRDEQVVALRSAVDTLQKQQQDTVADLRNGVLHTSLHQQQRGFEVEELRQRVSERDNHVLHLEEELAQALQESARLRRLVQVHEQSQNNNSVLQDFCNGNPEEVVPSPTASESYFGQLHDQAKAWFPRRSWIQASPVQSAPLSAAEHEASLLHRAVASSSASLRGHRSASPPGNKACVQRRNGSELERIPLRPLDPAGPQGVRETQDLKIQRQGWEASVEVPSKPVWSQEDTTLIEPSTLAAAPPPPPEVAGGTKSETCAGRSRPLGRSGEIPPGSRPSSVPPDGGAPQPSGATRGKSDRSPLGCRRAPQDRQRRESQPVNKEAGDQSTQLRDTLGGSHASSRGGLSGGELSQSRVAVVSVNAATPAAASGSIPVIEKSRSNHARVSSPSPSRISEVPAEVGNEAGPIRVIRHGPSTNPRQAANLSGAQSPNNTAMQQNPAARRVRTAAGSPSVRGIVVAESASKVHASQVTTASNTKRNGHNPAVLPQQTENVGRQPMPTAPDAILSTMKTASVSVPASTGPGELHAKFESMRDELKRRRSPGPRAPQALEQETLLGQRSPSRLL